MSKFQHPKFQVISEALNAVFAREIEPGSTVQCDHCQWAGKIGEFAGHLIGCTCANANHDHRKGQ